MLSENTIEYAIEVSSLGKSYQMYEKPSDRLKQMLLRGRKQYYKEFWALKGVSFQIKKGETVGIIGRNGSGKSTLLQMICGTLNPTEGEIKVHGRVAALLELGAGFNSEFTGIENVYMAASLYGLSHFEIDKRFTKITEFADIGEHINQPVKTYSSGMYVRLAFAVIAHVDAEILVVDEALAVGDVFFQQKCMRFLRDFQDKLGTILLVTHDTSTILNLCDRAVLLFPERDRLFATGSPDEVCKIYLEDIYRDFEKVKPVAQNSSNELIHNRSTENVFIGSNELITRYRVSAFNASSSAFGQRKASIIDTLLTDEEGNPLSECYAEQRVVLVIKARIDQDIASPAFGFMLKNRHGEFLFTEGTDSSFRAHKLFFRKGDISTVYFEFCMPTLISGIYTINVALADGVGDEHQQQHWIHDALVIESLPGRLVHGYCGVHNLKSRIEILLNDA